MFVAANICHDKFCHNIIFSWENFCHNKHTFVVTKDTFCCDKRHVVTNMGFMPTSRVCCGQNAVQIYNGSLDKTINLIPLVKNNRQKRSHTHIYTCMHVKDSVVHVRVRWITKTSKRPGMHYKNRWGAQSLAKSGEQHYVKAIDNNKPATSVGYSWQLVIHTIHNNFWIGK